MLALHAEVSWSDGNKPISQIPLDFKSLRNVTSKVGLVLRIGPYHGTYSKDDTTIEWLIQICRSMIAEANENQMEVSELQIDFNCAESKLSGYLLWIQAIRAANTPVPLTITALPSWMDQKDFKVLIEEVDSYVLQVHSVTPPRSTDQKIDLCPPDAARRAVNKAGSLNVPFRVALPTYGYLIAFDSMGKYVGLSAETLPPDWPTASSVEEAWSNPKSMADLVNGWERQHPCCMRGLIWFRMPVQGDRMNWSWQTLSVVRSGEIPSSNLHIHVEDIPNGLVEISLENLGNTSEFTAPEIQFEWKGGRMIDGSGIQGFRLHRSRSTRAIFSFESNKSHFRITPSQRIPNGWFLLNERLPLRTKLVKAPSERVK